MNKTAASDGSLKSLLFDRLPDEKFAKPQLARNENSNEDLGRLLNNALDNPLSYPQLSEAVFKGDQVAIALQSGLPRAKEIVLSLLNHVIPTLTFKGRQHETTH